MWHPRVWNQAPVWNISHLAHWTPSSSTLRKPTPFRTCLAALLYCATSYSLTANTSLRGPLKNKALLLGGFGNWTCSTDGAVSAAVPDLDGLSNSWGFQTQVPTPSPRQTEAARRAGWGWQGISMIARPLWCGEGFKDPVSHRQVGRRSGLRLVGLNS